MAWLCANAGYILSAKEKLALGRGERLMPWCPLVPTTVAILPKCSQCLNQIIISVFFRVVRAGLALLHSGNQQGTGHLQKAKLKGRGRTYLKLPWRPDSERGRIFLFFFYTRARDHFSLGDFTRTCTCI